jgi:signal transduction histidine kinase
LVRLHGGEIIAASEGPGLGSEFTVTLPGAVLSAPPRADSAPRSGAPGLAAS